ncbi:MAG: hypothetical protein M1838_000042 [Thelocarpon superellum]|nr:MAG: hypothetical protein M1838_000042 [Thelocarpon superellum]
MGLGFWALPAKAGDSVSAPEEATSKSLSPSDTQHAEKSVPRKLSRDEQAELELQEFIDQVSAEPSRPSNVSPTDAASSPSPSSISPDSLFPTSMSCRQAFDSAFYCQSMGGQFNNVYRYGGIKDCSEHWGAFWFCMRTRSYSDEERAKKVQDFYRGRAVKYKIGPSSEDVWEVRREPVTGAFNAELDAVEQKDTS